MLNENGLIRVYGKKNGTRKLVFHCIRFCDFEKKGKRTAENQGYTDFELEIVRNVFGGQQTR